MTRHPLAEGQAVCNGVAPAQLVRSLEVEPQVRAGAQRFGEGQCHVGGDRLLGVEDLRNSLNGLADDPGEFGDRPSALFEFVAQVLAWVEGLCGCVGQRHGFVSLAVVLDLEDGQ